MYLICYTNLHVVKRSELIDVYSKSLKIGLSKCGCPVCGKRTFFGNSVEMRDGL
jgi:hypothetical protein